jgi:hypothetical protein
MYKLFASLSFLLILSCNSSQHISSDKVPEAAKSAFAKLWPGATITEWEKQGSHYEASGKKEGKSVSATFKSNGTLLESEVEVIHEDLPQIALSYMKQHYPGVDIREISRLTKADGSVQYEVEADDKHLFFSADGKFLKEKNED